MRIGISAAELCGRPTGAGRYLAGLVDEWCRDARAQTHELILYAPEPLPAASAPPLVTRLVAGRGGAWWEQVALARAAAADRVDVFFAPAYAGPLLLSVPMVVAVHDVSFAAHPEWFRPREGARRRWLTRRSARRARAVVTISEFSREEIVRRLGVDPSRVHVIPPGVTPRCAPIDPAARGERVLFVGSIFNRRHVPDLIRAFALLARRRPSAMLDIVGDNRTYPYEDIDGAIRAAGLAGRVRWHRYTSDADLARLYREAGVFAFLSEYEGLGFTPLEALAAGVPPVLADTPVARETCGGAALYVASGDLEGVAAALERALTDRETRARILRADPAVLARYDWPRAARRTLELLERAHREG